jgi:hypothetical protein
MILAFFCSGGLPSRNNTDLKILLPVTVTDQQNPQLPAPPQKNKPVFLLGMIRIPDDAGGWIIKSGLGLFKGHPMLSLVSTSLGGVPHKLYIIHHDIIYTI